MTSVPPSPTPKAISVEDDGTFQARFSPVFVIEHPEKSYNLIGTPSAKTMENSTESVFVNPKKPTIYYEKRGFKTTRSEYTNLIFRVHFEKIPFNLLPFYLGAGENVGLIVVVTLDAKERSLLYTMVHTCGCYLAFIPTSFMPERAFPTNWNKDRQKVHSEELPGMLKYPRVFNNKIRLVLTLRHATHRVKDARLSDRESLRPYGLSNAHLKPLDSLETLPLGNGNFTSFYETSGPRKGYVKSSKKIWERLLMSWWTLDWRVGEDKKLGKNKKDGILFNTSLIPWRMEQSDMRDFSTFLKFWGWNL